MEELSRKRDQLGWGHMAGMYYGVVVRRPLPCALAAAMAITYGLLVVAAVGSIGALLGADEVDGVFVGLLVYGLIPGAAGAVAARRAWQGQGRARWALIGAHGLYVAQALGSLGRGDAHGLTQLVLPVTAIVLLSRASVREWYASDPYDRTERRPFSFARWIKWRTDEGQSMPEYAALLALIAAIVVGVVALGMNGTISRTVSSAVCTITGGGDCGGGGEGGGQGIQADPANPDADTGTDTPDGADTDTPGGADADTQGGPTDVTPVSNNNNDDDKGFWGQLGDVVTQPFKAAWEDVKGTWDAVTDPGKFLTDTWNGLKDYTTTWWEKKADDLGKQWDEGGWNYLTVPLKWVSSPEDFVSDFLIDSFIDKESFENGDWGKGTGNTIWNIGSVFIPGVGAAKWLQKLNKINKANKVRKLGDLAGDAAAKARKAREAGDVGAARKAADEAQQHADDAAKKARENPDDADLAEDARKAQEQALAARTDAAKAALRGRGSSVSDEQIDGLVQRAQDDPADGGISKRQAADALDDLADLASRPNVRPDAASSLEGKVANAKTADALDQARAEVHAVQRAADDAAPGTQVDAGPGTEAGRPADLGSETLDLDGIPDADVAYKAKDGTYHVVEVKNAGSATRKPAFANQVERLKKWADKAPGRKATVEIDSNDRWTQLFSEFKPGRGGKPAKDSRTAAGEMAKNDVDVSIGGKKLSAGELGRMQDAINERTRNGTMDWSKMTDPDAAREYLGV
ncbi:hypothetical protein H9Y04_34345 [Streptomyces sp. TRM66268-LWL]|uniref:Uncharacterized protein n=1 Tax=Streptomyces polyasparticus TaxID=2767826 RepID=A0ABR7SSH3_9ACTN|nr:hypothetical protein [Streptomyces polyasparticus]MBC9717625.1 hypothetical protein [Streptomyces polyasparticus]